MRCMASLRFVNSVARFAGRFSHPEIRVPVARYSRSASKISVTRVLSVRPMSQSSASESSNAAVEAEKTGDVLVQYVVLRRDLIDSWPLGSVVTQGCHAAVSAVWMSRDDAHTAEYCCPEKIDSMHKVALEVKGEPQILDLSEKLKTAGIDHKLWIEQPENSPTCLATKPYPKSTVLSYFKKLKLCK